MKDYTTFGIKVVAALCALTVFIFALSFWSQSAEQKVIEEQLEAIQDKRLTEAYFAFTSKDFQEASSLEDFKKFINRFPLFTNETSLTFEGTKTPGEVKLTLKNKEEEMHLIYTLSKEGEEWRIKGIEVAKEEPLLKEVPEFDTTLFLTPIKQHLEALKKGDFLTAYHETAEDFQAATPYSEFEAFTHSFPILTHLKNADYYKLTFNNNIGQYHVRLTGDNGEIYEAEYDLIKEKGQWKILQIQISDQPV